MPSYRQKRMQLVRFFLLLIFLIFVTVRIDLHIRPIIQSLAQSQAVVLSTRMIDDAVSSFIDKENISYDYLMHVQKDEKNKVTSIQADALHINSLKSEISIDISKEIEKIQNEKFSIPLGTLLGGDILSGRGPEITFYISLSGNVKTSLKSDFYEAGINQTLHAISLDIVASIYILCPGYNTATETATNIVIAETVIVGDVPETYNYINANLDDYVRNYPTAGD